MAISENGHRGSNRKAEPDSSRDENSKMRFYLELILLR